MDYPFTLTDAEWRARLTPEEYHVLREAGTERPFTNEYDRFFGEGTYLCRGCETPLFAGDTKFNSGCGWPAFYQAVEGGKVEEHEDRSFGMRRVECLCANCGSHLGHVFPDAPQTPTGRRYCINSLSVRFVPHGK